MVAFITPNRMRDEDEASNDETRLSDIDQVRNNFVYALDRFKLAHSEVTGAHTGLAVSQMLTLFSAASSGLGAAAGQASRTFMTTHTPSSSPPVVPIGIGGSVPTGVDNGLAECLLSVTTTGPNNSHLTNYRIRLITGTGTTIDNQAAYTTDPEVESVSPNTGEFPSFAVYDSNYPVCANHYDMAYRAAEILLAALEYQHDSDGLPEFGVANLDGSILHDLGLLTFPTISQVYKADAVLAHNGAYYALALGGVALSNGSQEMALMAGYDDTSAYLVQWYVSDATADTQIYYHALSIPLDSAAPTEADYDAPLADTFAKAQGYPHVPDDWEEQLNNARYLRALFLAEHDEDGTHQVALSHFPSYVAVKTAWAVTADSTIGNITTTLIEADPGDVLYLFGLVGASGSGIVSATIARDGVDVYLVLRRITAGTTNNFTATIWRVSRT